jgi:23S rRNA pseudouridine1911/1915/1917 synthase
MPSRTFIISRKEAGRALTSVLQARLRIPPPEARRLVAAGRVFLAGAACTDPGRKLAPGQRLEVRTESAATPRPPEGVTLPVVRYADADVVVVDKPPGLTTVRHPEDEAEFGARARRFLPPTLADVVPSLLPRSRRGGMPRLIAVHRLDKDTSGLVVFARTPQAARHLGRQFREHTVERTYLAVVRGHAAAGRIESRLVRDRRDGRRGSTTQAGEGQRAVTHVRVVEELGEYTLVECRLETGRTHQVRIHLGEAGTPLCGEHVYDRPPHGRPLADGSGTSRVALHAATLGFEHPRTGKRMRWTAPLPRDMRQLVERLRKPR